MRIGLASATIAAASVLGLGVGDHINDQNQTIVELKQGLEKEGQNVQNLTNQLGEINKLLQNEQTTNQAQATQMSELTTALSSKITLDQVMTAIQKASPSTVCLEGEVEVPNFFTGEMDKQSTHIGSGVILASEDGSKYILTCNHVTNASAFKRDGLPNGYYKVRVYTGSDYKAPLEFEAELLVLENGQNAAFDHTKYDMALLKIKDDVALPEGIGVKLRDLNKDPLIPGEPVIAIGGPAGHRDTVSFGIISNADRITPAGLSVGPSVQSDATITFGSSGGGLFDIEGRLVALNAWAVQGGDNISGAYRVDEIQKALTEWGITLKQ